MVRLERPLRARHLDRPIRRDLLAMGVLARRVHRPAHRRRERRSLPRELRLQRLCREERMRLLRVGEAVRERRRDGAEPSHVHDLDLDGGLVRFGRGRWDGLARRREPSDLRDEGDLRRLHARNLLRLVRGDPVVSLRDLQRTRRRDLLELGVLQQRLYRDGDDERRVRGEDQLRRLRAHAGLRLVRLEPRLPPRERHRPRSRDVQPMGVSRERLRGLRRARELRRLHRPERLRLVHGEG
jgi:hypothetical protein